MSQSLANQCWALAGIAQAARCVEVTARGAQPEEAAVVSLYRTLLEQEAPSMQALRSSGDLTLGLQTSAGMLHRPDEEHIQTLRYTLALLDATVRLRKAPAVVERLTQGIRRLDRDLLETPGFSSYDIPWDRLAEVYVDTLGSLNQRIQVRGTPALLQRKDIASKIRGLLLMGVRFAWLWHQLGGRRWQLLVNRRRMWQTTQLMAQLGHSGD